MRKRQRILVVLNPNDELDMQPEPALDRAVFLARETNAALELFVSDHNSSIYAQLVGRATNESSSNAYLRETMNRLQAITEALIKKEGLLVSTDVVWNRHQYDAIMHKVSQTKPDMVIKTTWHDNRLNRTLFNYTDWHLIRGCPCPLMLVKSEDMWETRRIVACVDPAHAYSQAETLDDCIIETAQMLAYKLRGELHVLHSVELLPESAFLLLRPESSYEEYKENTYQEHEALLDSLLRRYGIGYQRLHIAVGSPADTLISFVNEINASLVVMGAVSKGALESLFIGNTAEKVLDDLSCDILVVKSTPLEVRAWASEYAPC